MRNLVVIVADTLRRPSTVPGYGGKSTMPFLEGASPGAEVFPTAIASSPWTLPSHASLLAGSDPWQVHWHGAQIRAPRGPTLADRFREAGGESAAYSANGLLAPEYGFLREYGSLNRYALNRTVAPWAWEALHPLAQAGPREGGRLLGETGGAGGAAGAPSQEGAAAGPGSRVAGSLADLGVRFLLSGRMLISGVDRYLRRRRSDKPLHLFVNLMETHEPYRLRPSAGGGPVPKDFSLPMMSLAPRTARLTSVPEARGWVEEGYLRTLTQLDQRLSEVFEVLARRGVLRDAWVVLLSDHGQALGEQGFFGHGHSLQDEIVRVPCALWRFRRNEGVRDRAPYAEPFDLRHLHDALLGSLEEGGEGGLPAALGKAVAERGPPLSYWEGPDLLDVGTSRPESERRPLVRRLRIWKGDRDVVVEQGLVEERGRILYRPRPEDPRTDELVEEAGRILERSAPGTLPPGASNRNEVERRLRSWGYA